MKNLAMMVGLSFADKNRPRDNGLGQPARPGDELSRIRSIRAIKRHAKKPKMHRLDPQREQLVRRAQLPHWSCRDLTEWLYTEMRIRVSHTTVWRYLKKQPELSNSTNELSPKTAAGET